ncbi:MAG TPA: hypothetical protein VFF27_17365 [Bacteroidia bacterium]|jgi:HPt (histidine-containing phosphotransfer) domain-containing protein|nr:hypothetical protein [Bacteroidia bacterium]
MVSTQKSLVVKGAMLIVAGMLFTACGNEPQKDDNLNTVAKDSVVAEEPETNTVSYSLPSPLQIASIFKKSGLKYQDGITTAAKDPSKYTNNLSKSLNLGVYSADLSYCVLNKQNQEAQNYMKLCRQLAESLGMGSVFEQSNLSKRFEKNLNNEDSLAYIIAELQMVTDMYLDENEQPQITAIVFSGAWIESMYLGSKIYEKNKDKSMNTKLTEQMSILGSIINALKAVQKKDPAIDGLIADVQSIKDIYDNLPSVKANPIKEDEDKDITLTDDEVLKLTKRISELRAKFING